MYLYVCNVLQRYSPTLFDIWRLKMERNSEKTSKINADWRSQNSTENQVFRWLFRFFFAIEQHFLLHESRMVEWSHSIFDRFNSALIHTTHNTSSFFFIFGVRIISILLLTIHNEHLMSNSKISLTAYSITWGLTQCFIYCRKIIVKVDFIIMRSILGNQAQIFNIQHY